MDPNSNWNVDAGQITPSSHTRLNDMNDLFDPQELWNSMGDWLYDPHNFENQYEGYTPAAHHPSMHHDVNVLDLSELPQLSEMADTANAATVADADTFDRLKRWLDVDTANIDSSPGIDSSAIGQCWDRPNATDPNVDLGMHPMPPGDCSHQHFQTVDPNLVFPPNQASTSRDILTSNGVNAPICPSDCNAWNRHLASNAISEVGTLDFAMRAMHDYTITDHLAQANQYHTHLSRSRPAEERSFSNEPNTACFGASHMPISKKRRHRIPESVRNLLEQHFTTNAYPTPTQIDALALSTNQEPFRIRNWFSNARARRQAPGM